MFHIPKPNPTPENGHFPPRKCLVPRPVHVPFSKAKSHPRKKAFSTPTMPCSQTCKFFHFLKPNPTPEKRHFPPWQCLVPRPVYVPFSKAKSHPRKKAFLSRKMPCSKTWVFSIISCILWYRSVIFRSKSLACSESLECGTQRGEGSHVSRLRISKNDFRFVFSFNFFLRLLLKSRGHFINAINLLVLSFFRFYACALIKQTKHRSGMGILHPENNSMCVKRPFSGWEFKIFFCDRLRTLSKIPNHWFGG